jgi:hypothetical protein
MKKGEGEMEEFIVRGITMEYKVIEKKDYAGNKVKVLDVTFESGTPETKGVGEDRGWRGHFTDRNEMLRYLKNGERYWYSAEWYGSEKKR